jgi:radical SAM superfamily enzyme YgiQ (UPF0313 family)
LENANMKLLLTSVVGPFGVDDDFGRQENRMELFHNQVTREQGVFSLRFNHGSFGLRFLAENIDASSTILDFPSFDRFCTELRHGYDYVGISFIVPNLKKAQRMARAVRQLSPRSQIILGGHGVNIPGIEGLIEHDHLCRGEGVGFLRHLLGEDPDRPIRHPLVYSSFGRRVMGVPVANGSGVLVTGLGCQNRCRFCATAHFFDGYTPYLKTGKEIFEVCCAYESQLGVTDFGVLDENFLKMKPRALELLEEMEKANKRFTFGIFSSAETLRELGDLDQLVRLGVQFVWLGVESKEEIYAKNQGTDFHQLVSELRRRGISVLVSSILFLEHHNHETIWSDVDYAISLGPDYLQFMQLGPIPGTGLYRDYENKGKLLDVPFEDQHGQGQIWFKHPEFSREETADLLKQAFARDYQVNGASLVRVLKTMLMGYRYTSTHADPRVRCRAETFEQQLRRARPLLLAARAFSANPATEVLLREIRGELRTTFGRIGPQTAAASLVALAFAAGRAIRLKAVHQPKPSAIRLPAGRAADCLRLAEGS